MISAGPWRRLRCPRSTSPGRNPPCDRLPSRSPARPGRRLRVGMYSLRSRGCRPGRRMHRNRGWWRRDLVRRAAPTRRWWTSSTVPAPSPPLAPLSSQTDVTAAGQAPTRSEHSLLTLARHLVRRRSATSMLWRLSTGRPAVLPRAAPRNIDGHDRKPCAKPPLRQALLVSCDGVNRPGMMCMTFIHCSLMPASTMVWSARLAASSPAPLTKVAAALLHRSPWPWT